jgi:radical SAM-linked protein
MTDPNQPIAYPLLVRFAKTGMMRFVGHLDWLALQQAMFLKAGFAIVMGEGPTRRLKFKCSPPTPVSVASRCEFTYLLLADRLYPEEAMRRLRPQCPEGIEVLAVSDAGYLVRKNPFGRIEAASYRLELGENTTDSPLGAAADILGSIVDGRLSGETDAEELKGFKDRVLEFAPSDGSLSLLCLQREGDTFHGAKCAEFLEKKLDLPHYPLFTKMDYYRLTPSKRMLFKENR